MNISLGWPHRTATDGPAHGPDPVGALRPAASAPGPLDRGLATLVPRRTKPRGPSDEDREPHRMRRWPPSVDRGPRGDGPSGGTRDPDRPFLRGTRRRRPPLAHAPR